LPVHKKRVQRTTPAKHGSKKRKSPKPLKNASGKTGERVPIIKGGPHGLKRGKTQNSKLKGNVVGRLRRA